MQLFGQTVSSRIIDQRTGEVLAFAAIIEQGTVNGVYSDIDGRFELILIDSLNALEINLVGYEPLRVKNYRELVSPIALTSAKNILSEITIRPGLNPAERIIQLAIDHKESNDPEGSTAFTYSGYNKLIFGAAIDSTLLMDTLPSDLDTNTLSAINFLKQQHLFLMESVTERKFLPPNHSEETIIANRVSGLQNTELFLLATQLQSFSFYGESVELLGEKYMSPLANHAINKYYFELDDTTYLGNDTIFSISFRPRSNKNFSSMNGRLYINTNGYALQQVVAEPRQAGKMKIKIQQQYAFVQDKQWFPIQLNSSIQFSTVSVAAFPLIGEGRSYIKNIVFDPPLKASQFTPVAIEMLPNAGHAADSIWNKYREHSLDEKETKTYHFIDSIGQELHLDRRLKAIEALATGEVSIGYVNVDLRRLISFNNYEGFRLGAGLRTNHRLSEKFNTGGYVAYGFGDAAWKYGGDLLVHLNRKRNAWLSVEYRNDVMEMGGNTLRQSEQGGFMKDNLYRLFVSRMDKREVLQTRLNGRLIGNLTGTAFVNTQYIQSYADYAFLKTVQESVVLTDSNYQVTETGVVFRFAPGERLARTASREIRLGGRFPVFHFSYTAGVQGPLQGAYHYTRIDARIDKQFNIQNIGKLTVSAIAGGCPNDVPLSLLYNAEGSYEKFSIVAPGSFQTMRTNEFMHSRFVALHLRHAFMELSFFQGKFKPKVVLAHSMLWGDFQNKSSHSFIAKQAERGYFESGIQLDNLFVSGISGIGLGAYYRYGNYSLSKRADNLAIKLTTSFSF